MYGCIAIVFLVILGAQYFSLSVEIWEGLQEAGYFLIYSQALSMVPAYLTSGEGEMSAFLLNLVIGYIFAGLGYDKAVEYLTRKE